MRLSQWRAAAPSKSAATTSVIQVLEQVLVALGTERDPDAWIAWGDEPAVRWTIFVATPAGLVSAHVRVNIPGEGPRVSAKLTRWARVQAADLSIETQALHRLVSWQLEHQVLKGADDEADRIAAFALSMFDAIDGRVAAARPSRAPKATTSKPRRLPAGE